MKKSKYFETSLSQRAADGGKRYGELRGMGFGGRFETAAFTSSIRWAGEDTSLTNQAYDSMHWADVIYIKQGGTAGNISPVPAETGTGVFLFFSQEIIWERIWRRVEETMSEEKKIPYKIYLEENEMPTRWYNVRADMKLSLIHISEPTRPY